MTETEPIDVQVEKVVESASLAVGPHQPENATKPAITSAQAKIEAVASVTMSAYQKASQLNLSAEEIAALKADFPDEAFKPGAAGKESLIYIEHAFLRDRLDNALGMGQWALVPRNRWAEPFKTSGGKDGSRVYFEGMLMVRGCFVAEAIGEMEYYPHNASQNFGDACEGAESACLRRLCKKWGVGLQAWKKDWCEGWWQRKRGQKPAGRATPPSTPTPFAKTAPSQAAASAKATASDVLPKPATEATRKWMLEYLLKTLPKGAVLGYAREAAIILPDVEGLESWPLHHVPTDPKGLQELFNKISEWQKKNSLPPAVGTEDPAYFDVILTIPRKGMKRDEYLKNPDTIGSLYHAMKDGDKEAQSRLWGFAHNFEVQTSWEDRDGKEHLRKDGEIAADRKLRAALDEFMAEHGQGEGE